MKTIDLGEKLGAETKAVQPPKKWFPTIDFSDNGKKGGASFDEKDIGKTMTIRAEVKLVGIRTSTDRPKNKRFNYTLEVHKLHMGDDQASGAEQYKHLRQAGKKQ
jgi:hypothetical protein